MEFCIWCSTRGPVELFGARSMKDSPFRCQFARHGPLWHSAWLAVLVGGELKVANPLGGCGLGCPTW